MGRKEREPHYREKGRERGESLIDLSELFLRVEGQGKRKAVSRGTRRDRLKGNEHLQGPLWGKR